MPPTEEHGGIELDRVSSIAHSSAASTHEPDAQGILAADDEEQYDSLTGFRRWNLVTAVLLSMLLLGLDNTIVATVSLPLLLYNSRLVLTMNARLFPPCPMLSTV